MKSCKYTILVLLTLSTLPPRPPSILVYLSCSSTTPVHPILNWTRRFNRIPLFDHLSEIMAVTISSLLAAQRGFFPSSLLLRLWNKYKSPFRDERIRNFRALLFRTFDAIWIIPFDDSKRLWKIRFVAIKLGEKNLTT